MIFESVRLLALVAIGAGVVMAGFFVLTLGGVVAAVAVEVIKDFWRAQG